MKKKIIGLIMILFALFKMCSFDNSTKKAITSKPKNSSIYSNTMNELKIIYPELYNELLKLPEIKENTDKNKNAIEQIALLGLSSKNKSAFESMLNEGIKTKRKYCTPLEALLWIAYDKNIDKQNPLSDVNFEVSSLITDAWTTTSTSKNFRSSSWRNLNEVSDRLNSPSLIGIYMKLNFSYSYTPYEKEGVKSAEQIFKSKSGACYDYALFATYLLRKNGYDKAWGTSVVFKQAVEGYGGHVANIYQDPKDKHYYSMDFDVDGIGYISYGPFTSIEEAAKHISFGGSRGVSSLKKYKCFDIDLNKRKYIKKLDYFYMETI